MKLSIALKAHLLSTILYMVPIVYLTLVVINEDAKYIFAIGYVLLQLGIGMISYLEDWYFKTINN
jgi:hypothetical protein